MIRSGNSNQDNHPLKIAVTGAAGFIGCNLCESLLREGKQVLGLDNFDPFYDIQIKQKNIEVLREYPAFKFVKADLRDQETLEKVLQSYLPDMVIHLAAKAGVRPSIENPAEYYEVNVTGTLNLLEAMRKAGISRLIFASSSSVYGNNQKVPFSETDNVDFPISPYAATKKAGELLCHTYHHLYNFDIFCLRFFTVYGPRQRPDLAIYKFTNALLNNEEITFFGDGTTKRDYTHISDILRGIHVAMTQLKGFDIFNLGESRTTSLHDLVAYLERFTNKKAILKRLPLQPGDVEITYADIQKSRDKLNYHPNVPIEEGLKDFVEWFRQNQPVSLGSITGKE